MFFLKQVKLNSKATQDKTRNNTYERIFRKTGLELNNNITYVC